MTTNHAENTLLKAEAVAEYLEYIKRNPPGYHELTANLCPECGQVLDEDGKTTTQQTVFKCCNCKAQFVRNRHTLDIEPVYSW